LAVIVHVPFKGEFKLSEQNVSRFKDTPGRWCSTSRESRIFTRTAIC